MSKMALICGLYRVPPKAVAEYMRTARRFGMHRFDTAQLYGNEKACSDASLPTDIITTKIYDGASPGQIQNRVYRSKTRFTSRLTSKIQPGIHPAGANRTEIDGSGAEVAAEGSGQVQAKEVGRLGVDSGAKIDSILLHRPLPNECWLGLVTHAADIPSLGISNYDYNGLVHLLTYCEENQLRKPEVHQMEVHPFVDCELLITYCQAQQIRVEGHTVLTQGKMLAYPPLTALAEKYGVAPATILIAWAHSKSIDLCVNAGSDAHWQELVAGMTLVLAPEDMAAMNTWHQQAPHRFYTKLNRVPQTLNGVDDDFVDRLVQQLRIDLPSDYPSTLCEEVPITGIPYRTVGRSIAHRLYPDLNPEFAMNKYRQEMKRLRTLRSTNHKAHIQNKKGLLCCVVKRKEGEYSDSILHPRPMPVDVTDPNEFIPYFDFLKASETAPHSETVFIRGTIFPDGRMDCCKQVVGPASIGALCDAVNESKIVKHFLLGNNVALQDHEEDGAHAFARVMSNNYKPIETWYLAGNCIGPIGIEIMAEALQANTQCKALWLKRNPIGPIGAIALNRMLRVNTHLVLLDLHNCSLGNEGVSNLFQYPKEIQTLKHVYLDANAIESTEPIAEWCKVSSVVTLYLSINRLGDDEIMCLTHALQGKASLKRFCIASTHLGNSGLQRVVGMALSCPKLLSLNLGCYKSTGDMGEWPGNFFDDAVIPDLTTLLHESTSLQYLNIIGCKISRDGLATLPRLPHISMDLGAGPYHYVHDKNQLRFLKHPKRVVHIDSIYRGRM